jgi:prophage antirepressor-like protein
VTPAPWVILENVAEALGVDLDALREERLNAAEHVIRSALSAHEDAVNAATDEQHAIERRHGAGRE